MQMTDSDNQFFQFLSTQPRKGDLKKLEIIKAAIDCISTIGFEKTTYEAIAKKLNTRRAHIAYHFKDKSDIFKACIYYINYEYQNILYAQLEKAKSPKDKLLQYSDSPFIWASESPKHLSTMLLFYYLCCIDEAYNAVNNDIRITGRKRIVGILQNELKYKNSLIELETFALNMQNLISGSIIDAVSTSSISIEDAKLNTRKHVEKMLKQLGK